VNSGTEGRRSYGFGLTGRSRLMALPSRGHLPLNVVRWVNPRHGRADRDRDDGGMDDFPTYPSGLRLSGRRVVVVGGGHVAQRRVPGLLAVGADVYVVSPHVTPAIEGLVGAGEITWLERRFEASDLDDTWYVIAATNNRDAN